MNRADAAIASVAAPVTALFDLLREPRLSILIYHRVLSQPDPLIPDEVDAARFEAQMRVVRRVFTVLTLGEALALSAVRRLPPRALVITFDDGYADNAEVALPIIKRHGLKATFFIATGFLDGGRMFNDTVIESVRAARGDSIDLSVFGMGRRPLATVADRRSVVDALLPKVKYLGLAERDAWLDDLLRAAGRPRLPESLMMRSEQVLELHRAGMEIGGHTVNHPILRLLADASAESEIVRGRDRLQALTGSPVDVFAYPNGRPGQDYDDRHVRMIERLGFRGAVSTVAGCATARSDRFQLRRTNAWDRDVARWLARLVVERLRSRGALVAPAST